MGGTLQSATRHRGGGGGLRSGEVERNCAKHCRKIAKTAQLWGIAKNCGPEYTTQQPAHPPLLRVPHCPPGVHTDADVDADVGVESHVPPPPQREVIEGVGDNEHTCR